MKNREEKVIEIIKIVAEEKELGLNFFKTINAITNLRNDCQFDSLELAELSVRIEEQFDIDVFQNGQIQTVGDIFNQLQLLQSKPLEQ